MASKIKELLVMMPDEVGAGDKVLQALGAAKVNVTAFCGYGMQGRATLTFVVDPAHEGDAKKVLRKSGYKVETHTGIWANLAHKPGALAAITAKLAAKGINVIYAYSTVSGRKAGVAIFVDNVAKALKALA